MDIKNIGVSEWQRFVGLKQKANFCICKKIELLYEENRFQECKQTIGMWSL